MDDFFANIVATISSASKAVIDAVIETAQKLSRFFNELIKIIFRATLKFIRWVWEFYLQLENQILELFFDLVLMIYALRSFVLLISLPIVLIYFHQRTLSILYIVFISLAILFNHNQGNWKINREKEKEKHKQLRKKCAHLSHFPFRVLISAGLLFLTWHFVDWRSFDFIWFNKKIVMTDKEGFKGEEGHPQINLSGHVQPWVPVKEQTRLEEERRQADLEEQTHLEEERRQADLEEQTRLEEERRQADLEEQTRLEEERRQSTTVEQVNVEDQQIISNSLKNHIFDYNNNNNNGRYHAEKITQIEVIDLGPLIYGVKAKFKITKGQGNNSEPEYDQKFFWAEHKGCRDRSYFEVYKMEDTSF